MVVKIGNENPLPLSLQAAPDRGLLLQPASPGEWFRRSPPMDLDTLIEKAAGSSSLRSIRC